MTKLLITIAVFLAAMALTGFLAEAMVPRQRGQERRSGLDRRVER